MKNVQSPTLASSIHSLNSTTHCPKKGGYKLWIKVTSIKYVLPKGVLFRKMLDQGCSYLWGNRNDFPRQVGKPPLRRPELSLLPYVKQSVLNWRGPSQFRNGSESWCPIKTLSSLTSSFLLCLISKAPSLCSDVCLFMFRTVMWIFFFACFQKILTVCAES